MPRSFILIFFFSCSYLPGVAQQYLELIETSLQPETIAPYIDSYLLTRNGWLSAGTLPDTLRGGNAISPESALNGQRIDSLSGIFSVYLSPGMVRSAKLIPRVRYTKVEDTHAYFLTTVYRIDPDSNSVVAQFKILFDTRFHNRMPDVFDISIVNPEVVLKHAPDLIREELLRAPRKEELGLVP